MSFGLIDACANRNWRKARRIMTRHPEALWTETCWSGGPMYDFAFHGKLELMQYALELIRQQPEDVQDELLKTVFEGNCGYCRLQKPIHVVFRNNNIECLKFLIKNSPSGTAILEYADLGGGRTPAHYAAMYDPKGLAFVMRNAPSGVKVLEKADRYGQLPLDSQPEWLKQHYFNPHKVLQIGLESEYYRVKHNLFPDEQCLVNLVFGVIMQHTETQWWQLEKEKK